MPDMRLPPQPGEVIDRTRPLRFRWNGRSYSGLEGDTIASALAASGVRVFSRSFKYHRRRGILTADHLDPNLFVQVGAEPNVRAGQRRIQAGMQVRAQNAWPSLRFDVKAANRLVGRMLGPGFYYKTFIRPRSLQPMYQRVLRRFGSGGDVPPEVPQGRYDHRYAHPDVLVAGGGPAGMAAAIAAAEAGASVMLVDEHQFLGGHLRWGDTTELALLTELRDRVAVLDNIEVMTDSVVSGRYDDNWVAVLQRGIPGISERLVKARVKTLVVAAGTIERPYVFEGNDLVGVMLSTAVRRLVNIYAVKPGRRAVVFTANAGGDAAAADLQRVGIDVTLVDARDGGGIHRATGRNQVRSVELTDGTKVTCDLLVTAVGWTTPTALLNMAGDRPTYSQQAARFLPDALPDNVMATGGIIGDGGVEAIVAHGEAVGREAARRAATLRRVWQAATPAAASAEPAPDAQPIAHLQPGDHLELYRAGTHGIVDYSEDVSSQDLIAAVGEGYDSLELAKRFTTATMGPIQGKLEVANTVAIHAEATGVRIGEVGTTTWRPPYAPVSLGALAGPMFEPVRHTPMQSWHEANGAAPLVAGQWIRPEHYGDPVAEVRNVRTKVGIIDLTPLGKIDLRGKQIPDLLEFVYTNRWRKLAVGSVRYGVMCGEDGVIFDDGVTGRLGEHHYLMTTTSSGAGAVRNWLDEWLQTRFQGSDIRMTYFTDGYASINVAGPSSRELLARLVDDVELAADAFGYMRVRVGTVAGVADCVIWRIGFTGELSFELHVPASYGLHVWETLLERGADLGVAPFGVEAQRIMRLEKGHLIVGQDTDALTGVYQGGLGWAVKADKDDFAGKPEIGWQSEGQPSPLVVALQPIDPLAVPPEASQIVDGDQIVGRVTSSRLSPTLGRAICLAQVEAGLAAPGSVVSIVTPDGARMMATVMEHHSHFDPEGLRLRG